MTRNSFGKRKLRLGDIVIIDSHSGIEKAVRVEKITDEGFYINNRTGYLILIPLERCKRIIHFNEY